MVHRLDNAPTTAGMLACLAVLVSAWAATVPGAWAQSAADLRGRIVVDGVLDDWLPAENIFRDAAVCSLLALPGPCVDEEPDDDSAWSQLQDIRNVRVTWDAERLYLAVEASLADHALVVLLDTQPGGLDRMTELRQWRRGVRFGDAFQPDLLLAVRDRDRGAELWRVQSLEFLERVDADAFEAVATFEVDAAGRALEVALPWSVVFPLAPLAANADSIAPAEAMFVLPVGAAAQGLRLQAVVVHASDGWGAADVAPDASLPLPLAFRDGVDLDRAARIDWSPNRTSPDFVDFGVAVQTQSSARFVPDNGLAASSPIRFSRFDTHDLQAAGTPATRLLLADAGHELGFVFDFDAAQLQQIYVTASITSMRGEPTLVLYEHSLRQSSAQAAPWARFSDPNLDRWNGNGRRGEPVDAGMYLLRVIAGPSPGVEAARQQRTIVVVR